MEICKEVWEIGGQISGEECCRQRKQPVERPEEKACLEDLRSSKDCVVGVERWGEKLVRRSEK